ncbi:FadR/GntR family transcriptional regulator [Streptomyces radicis]|uniref:FadR family transcriptional regulator n=1 Tax=Streptomyces radicis TaxID=1750517 RepID=A0A3A9W1B6_9ACTN|nr:FCD domain-containing protein [Streptomyces radicis]RKN07051.1 FadR family transcriptional regulator [Streptomyces radicis]RKN15112.1 FadR family transcriptional regulator [Streptomyces radicis]
MSSYARRGVHGQTVEALARRVVSGAVPEGATLDLVALRDELGVSLTVLRESLKVLAAKGMVDARQKRGTFIRARSHWNLLDPDVLRWQFAAGVDAEPGTGLLRDLGEVRSIIEPAAARLAAERRDAADLRALETSLAAMAEAAPHGDPGPAVEADLAFHRALLAATRNELLRRMEIVLSAGLAERDQLVHGSAHSGDPVPSHRAVLDAVAAADPDAAEAAMRTLLDQAVRDLDNAHKERHI